MGMGLCLYCGRGTTQVLPRSPATSALYRRAEGLQLPMVCMAAMAATCAGLCGCLYWYHSSFSSCEYSRNDRITAIFCHKTLTNRILPRITSLAYQPFRLPLPLLVCLCVNQRCKPDGQRH